MGRLQAVEDTAFQVGRELPQLHTITRPFRGARFRKATERLLRELYALEWEHFQSPRDFELIEGALTFVVATIELHVLHTYKPQHDSECRFFRDMILRFRDARDAVRLGLPPNPGKRPTQQALEEATADRLAAILRRRPSARGIPGQDRAPVETSSAR